MTLKRILEIFPDLNGFVHVNGAYQSHEVLFGLILNLSQLGTLSSPNKLIKVLPETANPATKLLLQKGT